MCHFPYGSRHFCLSHNTHHLPILSCVAFWTSTHILHPRKHQPLSLSIVVVENLKTLFSATIQTIKTRTGQLQTPALAHEELFHWVRRVISRITDKALSCQGVGTAGES